MLFFTRCQYSSRWLVCWTPPCSGRSCSSSISLESVSSFCSGGIQKYREIQSHNPTQSSLVLPFCPTLLTDVGKSNHLLNSALLWPLILLLFFAEVVWPTILLSNRKSLGTLHPRHPLILTLLLSLAGWVAVNPFFCWTQLCPDPSSFSQIYKVYSAWIEGVLF